MSTTEIPYKIYLSENEIPKQWYNVRADMKNKPAPLLNPGTHQPLSAEELAPIFCDELIRQELDAVNGIIMHEGKDIFQIHSFIQIFTL